MAAPADTYTDQQITSEMVKVPGQGVQMDAILSRPKSDGAHPTVMDRSGKCVAVGPPGDILTLRV